MRRGVFSLRGVGRTELVRGGKRKPLHRGFARDDAFVILTSGALVRKYDASDQSILRDRYARPAKCRDGMDDLRSDSGSLDLRRRPRFGRATQYPGLKKSSPDR